MLIYMCSVSLKRRVCLGWFMALGRDGHGLELRSRLRGAAEGMMAQEVDVQPQGETAKGTRTL